MGENGVGISREMMGERITFLDFFHHINKVKLCKGLLGNAYSYVLLNGICLCVVTTLGKID